MHAMHAMCPTRRGFGLLSCFVTLGALAMMSAPTTSSAGTFCAPSTTTKTVETGGVKTTSTTDIPLGSDIAPGSPLGGTCWDEQPYPFGITSNGEPVTASSSAASYLVVTSMAFRAWNRGLAATTVAGEPGAANPFGVWIFNGSRWFPSPGFPGGKECPGHTIVWAGKKDYWLVGSPPQAGKWGNLCRFDGSRLLWEPLPIPLATEEHVAERAEVVNGQQVLKLKRGGITSAACFAWNDCWFFGDYGTVLRWNGKALSDASPARSQNSLQGEYTAAVAQQGPAGEPFGLAVGGTSEQAEISAPLEPEGPPPAQLYSSIGAAFSPLAFTPPTDPQLGDPYRTDLVAVAVDSAGQGWVAGNPAPLRLKEREGTSPFPDPSPPTARGFNPSNKPQPSPLVPVSSTGTPSSCAGPPSERFSYNMANTTREPGEEPGAFLWSSIAAVPGSGEALAGGRMRRAAAGSGPNEDATVGEPVIVQAGCEGATTATRFRIDDPSQLGMGFEAPADREGSVTAIAANATNDAWAATSEGRLLGLGANEPEPPHLYRLTNGEAPRAPEGNDEEERPSETEEDKAILVIEPPPPEPPPETPPVVTRAHTITLPAAVYDIKAKLHTTKVHGRLELSLYLTFKLRRPVTIGAKALRDGQVVSVAKPRHFTKRTGRLILSLNRKHWPTSVKFDT